MNEINRLNNNYYHPNFLFIDDERATPIVGCPDALHPNMKITIDTKWVETLRDFDIETKVVLYEAIFDYMSDEEVNLPDDTWRMFAILKAQLDEERNKRMRLAERSRANGAKGGRKASGKKPKMEKPSVPIIPEGNRSEKLLALDNWMKEKTPYLYKNIRLLTQAEFDSLCGKYTSAQICDTLQQIENRKDLRKNYTNLYRTLLNWLKNGS